MNTQPGPGASRSPADWEVWERRERRPGPEASCSSADWEVWERRERPAWSRSIPLPSQLGGLGNVVNTQPGPGASPADNEFGSLYFTTVCITKGAPKVAPVISCYNSFYIILSYLILSYLTLPSE